MSTQAFPWRSLLLAPLASIPAAVVAGLGSSDGGLASDVTWGMFFAILLGVPASYIGMATVGVPAYLVLRKFGLLRLWIFGVVGALVPLVLFAGSAPFRTSLMAVLSGAAVGLTAYFLLPSNAKLAATVGDDSDA